MGTRKLVAVSSALLLLPLVGWFFALQNPSTPFSTLMILAFLAGIGGGVFSGFMPSTQLLLPAAAVRAPRSGCRPASATSG